MSENWLVVWQCFGNREMFHTWDSSDHGDNCSSIRSDLSSSIIEFDSNSRGDFAVIIEINELVNVMDL